MLSKKLILAAGGGDAYDGPTGETVEQIDTYRHTTYLRDVYQMLYSEGILYVSDILDHSILTFSISESGLITFLDRTASTSFLEQPKGLALDKDGEILYASTRDGVATIDVSNPSDTSIITPNLVDTLYLAECAIDPATNTLFVIAGGSISSIDLTNTPVLSTIQKLSNSTAFGNTEFIRIQNGIAYCTSPRNDRITSVDISDPANMFVIQTVTNEFDYDNVRGFDITESGVLLIASSSRNAVLSVDANDLDNEIGSVSDSEIMNLMWDFRIADGIGIGCSNIGGYFMTFDISDPANLSLINWTKRVSTDTAKRVAYGEGNIAFVYGGADTSIATMDIT